MVWYQASGPHLDSGGAAIFGEQVAIERVVVVAEKGTRAPIAPLGDMVRMAGDDDTGKAAPCGILPGGRPSVALDTRSRRSRLKLVLLPLASVAIARMAP
jgi:hypothetical protein